jgi:hypothetical protein
MTNGKRIIMEFHLTKVGKVWLNDSRYALLNNQNLFRPMTDNEILLD